MSQTQPPRKRVVRAAYANSTAAHKVRIIGGRYRRSPLAVVEAPGLRPTPDRVRETLFNWVAHLWDNDFSQRQVLDLFAGSGALGFEAASRGATQVVLVERDNRALDALHEARARLKADEVEIVAGDARHAVAGLSARRFDLVFFDPPFGEDWMTRVWADVVPLLAPDALVYVEAGEAIEPPEGMAVLRRAKAGSVHYCLLQPAGATPPDEA